MKKTKKYLSFLMVLVMTFQIMATLDIKLVKAAEGVTALDNKISKLRILELADTAKLISLGETPIKKYMPSVHKYTDIEITTMSMKTFAAMREEIDGKYDVIYIGSAEYSTATKGENVELTNFNSDINDGLINTIKSTDAINDITTLKVEEINKFLSDANNYLVVHEDIKDITKIDENSLVYKSYANATKSNILFVNSKDAGGIAATTVENAEKNEATNFYNKLFLDAIRGKISIHPNLASVEGLNTSITKGQRKEIKFKISNATYLKGRVKDVKIYLYADENANAVFEASEVVAKSSIETFTSNDTVYSIGYVPSGTYKNIPLKLEAVAENGTNNTKFYETDLFTFNGDKLNLNVLQVLGQGVTEFATFSDTNYNVNVVGRYLQKNPPNNNSRNELIFEYIASEIKFDSTDAFEKKVFDKVVETQKLTNANYTFENFKTENDSNKIKFYNEAKIVCYLEEYDILLLGISNERYLKNISSNLTTDEANSYIIYFNKLIEQFKNDTNKRVIFTRDVFRKETGDVLSDTINKNFAGNLSGESGLTITANGNVGVKTIIPVNEGVIRRPRIFETDKINVDFQGVFRLNLNQKDIVVWYNCGTGGGDNSYDLYHTYTKDNLVFTQAGNKNDDIELIRNIILMAGQSINKTQTYKLKVLEINDRGVSDLQAKALGTGIEIDYMTMKAFVALREELDGKYDYIYIGKGTYCPDVLGDQGEKETPNTDNTTRLMAHDTSEIMNDITTLKANELNNYVSTGSVKLLVDNSIYQQAQNINMIKYRTQGNSAQQKTILMDYYENGNYVTKNVTGFRIKEATTVSGILKTAFNITEGTYFSKATTVDEAWNKIKATKSERPLFTLSQKPYEYNEGGIAFYKKGDIVKFDYELEAGKTATNAKLYFDMNFDNRYDADELIVSSGVSGSTGTLDYTLEESYSGIRMWKIELEATSNKQSYKTGSFKFIDHVVNVKVLQVGTGKNDNLNNVAGMKSKFSKSEEYNIVLDYTTVDEFNKITGLGAADIRFLEQYRDAKISGSISSAQQSKYEILDATITKKFKELNSKYNMLLFGFADIYGSLVDINQASANIIQKYIDSDQSVMFTHDVFRYTTLNWFENFGKQLGIGETIHGISSSSNIARQAAGTTLHTVKVNSGLVSDYPNNLTDVIKLAPTHDQFYTLNLEDKDVVVWYNMIRDYKVTTADDYSKYYINNMINSDSWHHYYTYSVKNITYSGTGHSGGTLAEQEQQLFINTMYKAFLSANHPPFVEISKPTPENAATANYSEYDYKAAVQAAVEAESTLDTIYIPADVSKFYFRYTAMDYDLSDPYLSSEITIAKGIHAKLSDIPEEKYIKDSTASDKLKIIKTNFNKDQRQEALMDNYIKILGEEYTIIITVTDTKGANVTKLVHVKTKEGKITISPKPLRLVMDSKTPAPTTGTLTANVLAADAGSTVHWVFTDASGNEVPSNGCIENVSFADGDTITVIAAQEGTQYITAYYQKANNLAGEKFLDSVPVIVSIASDAEGVISPVKEGNIVLEFEMLPMEGIKYENFSLKLKTEDTDNNIEISKITLNKTPEIVNLSKTGTLLNVEQTFNLGTYMTQGHIKISITPNYGAGLDAYTTAVRNGKNIILNVTISADKYTKNPNYGKVEYPTAPEYNYAGPEDVMTATGIKIKYINIPKIQ